MLQPVVGLVLVAFEEDDEDKVLLFVSSDCIVGLLKPHTF